MVAGGDHDTGRRSLGEEVLDNDAHQKLVLPTDYGANDENT